MIKAPKAVQKFNEEVPDQEKFKIYLIFFLIAVTLIGIVGNSLRLDSHKELIGHKPMQFIVGDVDRRLITAERQMKNLQEQITSLQLQMDNIHEMEMNSVMPPAPAQMILQEKFYGIPEEVAKEEIEPYEERVKRSKEPHK